MSWNWQKPEWPNFIYEKDSIADREQQFLLQAGKLLGVAACFGVDEQAQMTIDVISDEALSTSEIEGEYLNRESVRSSIRCQLGFGKERVASKPGEEGVAEMMVALYQQHQQSLTHDMLFDWNLKVTRGHWELGSVGCYRHQDESMEIVSGHIGNPRVHYEVPPSSRIQKEMDMFIEWYHKSASQNLPALTRAAIAHLYFVCIHPFEGGNGRIARAIAIKSLSESLTQPLLLLLSQVIANDKKAYYQALAQTNTSLDIQGWIEYFSATVLEALNETGQVISFLLAKTRFFDVYADQLNDRQHAVVQRMFREGIKGFEGGLSAHNYSVIAKVSASTVTRDLQSLVAMGALRRDGDLKGARYYLNLAQIFS